MAGRRRFAEATLWVRQANTRARAFYAALGWHEDGGSRMNVIAGKVAVNELRYRRSLDREPSRKC